MELETETKLRTLNKKIEHFLGIIFTMPIQEQKEKLEVLLNSEMMSSNLLLKRPIISYSKKLTSKSVRIIYMTIIMDILLM